MSSKGTPINQAPWQFPAFIRFAAHLLVCFLLPFAALGEDLDVGRRIYEQGILPDGKPLTGVGAAGIPLSGPEAACANCHRLSGMGGLEGTTFIPPISADFLFHPEKHRLAVTDPSQPMGITVADHAYSDSGLAALIKQGVDYKGRTVNPAMPRYALEDEPMARLIDFLHTLSSKPSFGVDSDALHFATVFTPEVDEKTKSLVRAEIEAFALQHNSNMSMAQRHRRIGFGRLPHTPRPWVFHFWDLKGEPSSWIAQLDAYYHQQPVFALVSGVSFQSAYPVQEFCETRKTPCLFRSVLYPPAAMGYYSVYFSKGMGLDAQLFASALKTGIIKKPSRVLQLLPPDAPGERIAAQLGSRLQELGIAEDRMALTKENLPAIRRKLRSPKTRETIVCWCGQSDLDRLGKIRIPAQSRIYLSGSSLMMKSGLKQLPPGWRAARVIYPYELPNERLRQLSSFYSWISGHQFEPSNETIQSDAYFAMLILQEAIAEMVDNLYKDYLIERVENILGMSYDYWGIYSRPSLGQGQRYANRSGYIVKFEGGRWVQDADRIVEE